MESQNNYKDLIPCYPFQSSSRYLIQYFAIVGYDETYYDSLTCESNLSSNKYDPIIISSITSMNNTEENWNNTIIIRQIYPENPPILSVNSVNGNNSPTKREATSSMIFSLNFNSEKGDSKCLIMCYAYLFYEKLNANFYIPKAFCVISQYPFFSTFKSLCYQLHNNSSSNPLQKMPLEYNICTIVNCFPSPITQNLQYKFFNKSPAIFLPKLSGYPYIDFNLSVLFHYLPKQIVLKIYTMTIVEMNIVFFSANLEALNMIMYIFSILNFPCNDSNYSWHIVSISKENFLNENKAQFSVKPYSSILGVNTSYDELMKDNKNLNRTMSFAVVDIDNKKILFKGCKDKTENNDEKSLYKIYNYIERITNFSLKSPTFLKKYLNELSTVLEKQFESSDYDYYDNSFFLGEKHRPGLRRLNLEIQSAFYNCTLNILRVFYSDLVKEYQKVMNPFGKGSTKSFTHKLCGDRDIIHNKTMTPQQCKIARTSEEKIISYDDSSQDNNNNDIKGFKYEFVGTIQYNSFFLNYIKAFQCDSTNQIALLFSEEFIALKSSNTFNDISQSYLNIIDSYYEYHYTNNWTQIDCDVFYNSTLVNNRFLYDDSHIKPNNNIISFNQQLILKYLHYLNEINASSFGDYFPFHQALSLDPLIKVSKESISDFIEDKVLQKDMSQGNELIIGAFIYMTGILMMYKRDRLREKLDQIIGLIEHFDYKRRKYIIVILKFMNSYLIMHKNSIHYDSDHKIIIEYVQVLKRKFTEIKMMPNEIQLNISRLFSSQDEFIDEGNTNTNTITNASTHNNFTEENDDYMPINYSKSYKENVFRNEIGLSPNGDQRESNRLSTENNSDIKLMAYLKNCRTKNGNIKEDAINDWANKEKENCYYDRDKMLNNKSNPDMTQSRMSLIFSMKDPVYCVKIQGKNCTSKICSPLKLLEQIRDLANEYFLDIDNDKINLSFPTIMNFPLFHEIIINCIFYLKSYDLPKKKDKDKEKDKEKDREREEQSKYHFLEGELHHFYQEIVIENNLENNIE